MDGANSSIEKASYRSHWNDGLTPINDIHIGRTHCGQHISVRRRIRFLFSYFRIHYTVLLSTLVNIGTTIGRIEFFPGFLIGFSALTSWVSSDLKNKERRARQTCCKVYRWVVRFRTLVRGLSRLALLNKSRFFLIKTSLYSCLMQISFYVCDFGDDRTIHVCSLICFLEFILSPWYENSTNGWNLALTGILV